MFLYEFTCDECYSTKRTVNQPTPVGVTSDPQIVDLFCEGGEMWNAGWRHITRRRDEAVIFCGDCIFRLTQPAWTPESSVTS